MDFLSSNFMPHGYCLRWDPNLLVVFVVGNILIFLAYFSIPGALSVFVRKRRDLVFPWLFTLFAVFIFLCGLTHLVKVITIWHALYWLEASLDLVTGVISIVTAVLLWKLIPTAVRLPSPKQYKEANEKLSKLADIVESSEDGIIGITPEGIITSWNKGARKLLGYESDEVIGKAISVLVPENKSTDYMEQFHLLVKDETNNSFDGVHKCKDGRLIDLSTTVSLVKTEERDEIVGISFVCKDVTKKRKVEENLKFARDQALEAAKFKSEFLAKMSHEIRTPLNAVIGMSDLLGRSNLNEEQKDYAKTIVSSGNILLDLINNILDYSKLEAQKLELEFVEFKLLTVVEETAEILSSRAREKNLSLMTYVDPELPAQFRGDPGRVRQILTNLIGNAIKFTEEGEITVRVVLESIIGDSIVVRTTITDTGIGIKNEEIKELFSPYQQASVHNIHGGTGLGLSISKQLVNLMDGDIGIASSSSEGSSFWFTITLEAASEKFSYPDVSESGNLKILLIDGPEGSSSILKDYLESWGLQSHTVTNWEEASKKFAQDSYDFVFIDNNLEDAFDKKRLDSIKTREMSLVLVTACNDTDIGSQAIRVGYSACLIKPIRQSHLFDCIANLKGLNHLSSRTSDIETTLERPLAKEITESSLILVVEDNPVNQKVALLQLRDLGFAAHAVGNGEEALSAASTTSYTMILMDCQMPILDGYEATKELRKREAITGKRTPIIAMTAHAMKGDRERCLAAGMDDYISKPVNQDKLRKITDKWLGITSSDSEESTFTVTIEYEILEKTFGKEARQEILDTFIESMEVRLLKIDAAIEDQELDAVAALLHDIKGMASSVFATELSRLAYITERRIQDKSDDWQYISKNFFEMKTLFKKIKQEINQLNSSKNGY